MFEILAEDGKARIGVLKTAHGIVETPFIMPVATKGSVKFMTPDLLNSVGNKALIANGLILSQNPGDDFIAKMGGLHTFMGYDHTIFTDSGGFQMIVDSFYVKTTDDGVILNNPVNGKKNFLLSPESCIKMQEKLGSDVMMVLDDHNKYEKSKEDHAKAVERTFLWGKRCFEARTSKMQLLFGIVQGGTFADLRKKSASLTASIPFDGYAIGGLGIGESDVECFKAIDVCTSVLPSDKIRYAMGIGKPLQLLEGIAHGVDCFDSIYPTVSARHNSLFTKNGIVYINKAKWKNDMGPLEEGCDCFTCARFSKAFLHHLVRTGEKIVLQYLTVHNVRFMHRLMEDVRKAIKEKRFKEFKSEFEKRWKKS